jgi:acetolactate synthase-1/3 small subunit
MTTIKHIEREMVLIKVRALAGSARQEALSLVGVFRAKVVDICESGLIIETTGNWEKVNALLELLKPLGVVETVRTGVVAMARLSERGFDEEAYEEEIAV